MRVGPPGRQPGPRSPALRVPGCSSCRSCRSCRSYRSCPSFPRSQLPPMFGQLTGLRRPRRGSVGLPVASRDSMDRSVVVGADEAAGAGLAADTAATAPPMTRSAASEAVRMVRRRPECPGCCCGAIGVEGTGASGVRGAGATGVMGAGRPEGSCHSKGSSPLSLVWIVVSFTVVPWHLLGPVGSGVDIAGRTACRCRPDSIVAIAPENGVKASTGFRARGAAAGRGTTSRGPARTGSRGLSPGAAPRRNRSPRGTDSEHDRSPRRPRGPRPRPVASTAGS